MDWIGATEQARILKNDCFFSPTLFHYMFACIGAMAKNPDGSAYVPEQELKDTLEKCVKLKKNFGGRVAFHEHMVAHNARKYCKEYHKMILPVLDLMYLTNGYSIAACDPTALPPMIKMIDQEMFKYPKATDLSTYCSLLFYKAVCLSRQGATLLAEKFFMEILAW